MASFRDLLYSIRPRARIWYTLVLFTLTALSRVILQKLLVNSGTRTGIRASIYLGGCKMLAIFSSSVYIATLFPGLPRETRGEGLKKVRVVSKIFVDIYFSGMV